MSINKKEILIKTSELEEQLNELRVIAEAPEVIDYKTIFTSKIACEILGIRHRIPYADPENYHEEATNAYYELTVIIAAVWKVKGVKLETKNIKQSKYWPWAKQHPSGVGLSFCGYVYYCGVTSTVSGVRLASPDYETMKWIFDTFTPLYNKMDNQ